MRSTFKTLFYINRQKIKADGSCPVMVESPLTGKSASIIRAKILTPPHFGM